MSATGLTSAGLAGPTKRGQIPPWQRRTNVWRGV